MSVCDCVSFFFLVDWPLKVKKKVLIPDFERTNQECGVSAQVKGCSSFNESVSKNTMCSVCPY